MVLLNVRGLLVRVSVPSLSQTKDGQKTVEGGFGAAVEADEQQEDNSGNNSNNDTSDGSAAEATARLLLNERSIDAGWDGRGERESDGWGTGGCDHGYSIARRAHWCGRVYDTGNAWRSRASTNRFAYSFYGVRAVVSTLAALAQARLLSIAARQGWGWCCADESTPD